MPTYEYHCESCDYTMNAFQKITDHPKKECPECGQGTLRRGPGGGIGLIFRGSGFYVNDYGQKKSSKETSPKKTKSCPCGKKESSCHE